MFEGTVIGYRAWKIDPDKRMLCGPVSRTVWPCDRKLEASCEEIFASKKGRDFARIEAPHQTPGHECPCGIYGFHSLEDARYFGIHSTTVLGVAAFWGRISVHTTGFKAQFARILAIADHLEDRDLGWTTALDSITERYMIPAIPEDLLEQYGLTFGEPLGVRFEE